MRIRTLLLRSGVGFLLGLAVVVALLGVAGPSAGYVEAPHSLGSVIQLSSHIMVVQVEKVDREKNLILFRKVRDLKGTHPTDVIRHNIGRGGFHPREWQYPMEWAEPGKKAIFFHNGGASETCLGTYWYQAYAGGEWWNMSHGEPFLLRSFAGNVDKLAAAVTEVLAGREVVVPCMADGNKEDLHLRRARIQRMRVSLKLLDYNPKRDFVGWGGEDFRRVLGMPGFTHLSTVARVDADAQAISVVDYDGDGKTDLCLLGAGRLALLQNGGEAMSESSLPGVSGGRAAVWADYDADGRPDLLVATPEGPKLFTNRADGFRDDSHLLPVLPAYNLTAAAWIDADADGRPDLLLGNGFHGLRLFRNAGPASNRQPLVLGPWQVIGPFDNAGGRGFDAEYPPEKEFDPARKYPGRNGEEAAWKEGKFPDGQVNNLAIFKPENNSDSVVYVSREIECSHPTELPVSLGSDDSLKVWLNGERLLAENVARACAPDQNALTLRLRAGKNRLLLKIGQGSGDWAFYFAAKKDIPRPITWGFEDATARLLPNADAMPRGDTLTAADVNGDGRTDFLYGAGTGMLFLNTPGGFVESKQSGITYTPGQVGPVFGDADGDGRPDLLVPQPGRCRLFRNLGEGRFADVTGNTGDLGKALPRPTSACWGDLDNDGDLDLLVGCLFGPNRCFRNEGDGRFSDITVSLGLNQRIFNSQAVALFDQNGDGVPDMVFNNEGQESAILLGNPERLAPGRTAVTLAVGGTEGVVGSEVRVLDGSGKPRAVRYLDGGSGRGGQEAPFARFALEPGTYRVEVRYSSGLRRGREITVAGKPVREALDDKTPRLE